jgi:anti-sigma factor (TIGR02949 family)
MTLSNSDFNNMGVGCNEVLNSFVLLIEGNIEPLQINMIEVHISTCPACEAELAHEQAMRQLMQDVLRRSCDEKAPADLHDAIYRQIHGQMTGTVTEVITQHSMTEVSIEIDEFGQIELREVTIEHTEEILFLNPGVPNSNRPAADGAADDQLDGRNNPDGTGR